MLTDTQLNLIQEETVKGRAASDAYEKFIKSFLANKKQLLTEHFFAAAVDNVDMLQEIKRQSLVLDALEQEIKTIIETGKLANIQLTKHMEQQ